LVGYSSEDNAWTIKNSWGTGWGNKGFAKILNTEGEGVCGINMTPTFPTANWDIINNLNLFIII